MARDDAGIGQLLQAIDEAYDRAAFHGTNLRGSLRGVTAEEAARRPGGQVGSGERHNIWELTVHAAYWKYAVRRRLTGEKRGSFALAGSNWFTRPGEDAGEAAWKADVALLGDEHRRLREVIAALPPAARTPEALRLIRGIAAHDLYHCGQIQLIKKLVRG